MRHNWWVVRHLLSGSVVTLCTCVAAPAHAQVVSQRGFVEGLLTAFPQEAVNDSTQVVGDLLARQEVFVKPTRWLQFAGGLELRANSHDQVEQSWDIDWLDRTTRRPRLAVRRLTATMAVGPFTMDLGKQFVRWGVTDIVSPTDRLAPRDFINVVHSYFLPISGARTVVQVGSHTIDVVWLPWFTPSRIPLLDQRWTPVPADTTQVSLVRAPAVLPGGSQTGVRWGHRAGDVTYSLSYFDGFNHYPDIRPTITSRFPSAVPATVDVTTLFPPIRSYGGDLTLPTLGFTLKVEAAYVTTTSPASDEYGLYVVQLERQHGEWVFVGGYAGEAVTRRQSQLTFAPDRGLSKSIIGRVARSVHGTGSLVLESAVRQNGRGAYGRVQYSRPHGQHWRTTVSAVLLGGRSDDFFGQYDQNSHLALWLRYSY